MRTSKARVWTGVFLLIAGATGVAQGLSAGALPHVFQSINVAIIDSPVVTNGGEFPTTTSGPTGAFTDFTFTNVALADISVANLTPFDTILLNVASGGIGCDLSALSASQKADLVALASAGKKLIIYDSECETGDYSWLPFPFTTSNPGAAGATGTFNIVENNLLASNDPADSHFIDAALVSGDTDAIGDANVFTTFDPNWCVASTGTNSLGVNGPVHTYARLDNGLIIYNGMDVDDMDSATAPETSTGPGNLAKIWLQELQQPGDESGLPCGVSAVGISLMPQTATNQPGTMHSLTARVTDPVGAPQVGVVVTFTILSGPNAGATGSCLPSPACSTSAGGLVSFAYTGANNEGTDQIQACFTGPSGEVCSVTVTKTWSVTAPIPTSTVVPTPTTPTSVVVPPTTVACPGGTGGSGGNTNVNCNDNSSTNNNTNTNTNNNTQNQTNNQTQTGDDNMNTNVINLIGVHNFGEGPLGHDGGGKVVDHRGQPLARTGSELRPMAGAGAVAVLFGGLLLFGSRRRLAGANVAGLLGRRRRTRFGTRGWR